MSTMNLGKNDRLIRTVLGAIMLRNAYASPLLRLWNLLAGIGLVMSALKGFCPLTKRLGFSTVKGSNDNLMNQLKQMAPGQGVHPMKTQQATPQNQSQAIDPDRPYAAAVNIG